jgi:hypothetical protein
MHAIAWRGSGPGRCCGAAATVPAASCAGRVAKKPLSGYIGRPFPSNQRENRLLTTAMRRQFFFFGYFWFYLSPRRSS